MARRIAVCIGKEKLTTDIFCLQEGDEIARNALRQSLPDYVEFTYEKRFPDAIDKVHAKFDLVTYVKNTKHVDGSSKLFELAADASAFLANDVRIGDRVIKVVNVHGISYKVYDKLDTDGRLLQTNEIIRTFQDANQPVLVIGDFNLLPQARSVQLFTEHGYRNLVADYGILTTRNRFALERYPDNIQLFADYAFVNSSVSVR